MGLLWGQCALRAKLPFSAYASVITLTSDITDIKHGYSPLEVTEGPEQSLSSLTDLSEKNTGGEIHENNYMQMR